MSQMPSMPEMERENPNVSSTSLAGRAASILRQAHAVVPRSTYRFQFHKGFTFDDAIAVLPYLKALGVSHVYASPLLEARFNSAHGYDITDHNKINPELGGEERFRAFVEYVKGAGMGIVLDFVPNHMGIGTGNQWWRDVQKHGRCSRFAHYFDIDWEPTKPELRNKLLLPILGAPYGAELEAGNLKLELRDAELVIRYYDHTFPISLNSVPMILEESAEDGATDILQRLRSLPSHCSTAPAQVEARQQLTSGLEQDLRDWISTVEGAGVVETALPRFNGVPGNPASFDPLHRLLEAQAYRLAFWRVSGEEINYRRFFDVNDLVGLRQEFPDVFAATHHLLRRMLAAKQIDGVRIDHVDGLYNPLQYLIRLQMLDVAAETCGADPCGPLAENGIEFSVQEALTDTDYSRSTTPLYCLVEKIWNRVSNCRTSGRFTGLPATNSSTC